MDIDPGIDSCTRCGFCLPACPTYREIGLEADSPRGRIYLMKRAMEGDADARASMADHLYVCLGCRACETACPSGVPFGKLLEQGRAAIESDGDVYPRRTGWRAFRRIAFEWVLPRRWLFALAMAPARLFQRVPWLRQMLLALPIGARARSLLEMLPAEPAHARTSSRPPGGREASMRVGLFAGCVMDALFSGVHDDLARVLASSGYEVVRPGRQWCCGALNVHAGERRYAGDMARRNIDAFAREHLDAIAVDSSGCGAHLKSYGELLRDDPAYATRAAAFSAKVKDCSELLAEIQAPTRMRSVPIRATYLDACHLLHGQRVSAQPRALLKAIPGLEFVELGSGGRCCGAAGVYSLTHPAMSTKILDETMARVKATGADTVVVANPGCHMQLLAGAARSKLPIRVRHLVEVIAEAWT